MHAKPLFENILVKPIQKKKETKSGILVPSNTDQNNMMEGVVEAVGDGDHLPVSFTKIGGMSDVFKKPIVVKIGQHVVFKQYASTPLKLDGEQYYLVNQRDCLAVITYD